MGDLYRENNGEGWKIACYFVTTEKETIRRGFPIEMLPMLTCGATYPSNITTADILGYRGRVNLPEMNRRVTATYGELPNSLKRMHKYADQIANQKFIGIEADDKIVWIPVLELARRLHYCSAETVRASIYSGTTQTLARANSEGRKGYIDFTVDVPQSYLNYLAYRRYFAWLFFDEEATQSFTSIFKHLNREAQFVNGIERWTFNFTPPDLTGCEISWFGYTGREEERHHCYARSINSIAGLSFPDLDYIVFSHPDDKHYLESLSSEITKKSRQKKILRENILDTLATTSPYKAIQLTEPDKIGLHFQSELELKRASREAKTIPPANEIVFEETEEKTENLGIKYPAKSGNDRRVDSNMLCEPETISGSIKFDLFKQMIELLAGSINSSYKLEFGSVPRCNCRSAHLIEGRKRQYAFVEFEQYKGEIINILEIELKDEERLSTLIFRSVNAKEALFNILNGLMKNSVSWNKNINTRTTTTRSYVEHPLKLLNSNEERLKVWADRIRSKLNAL